MPIPPIPNVWEIHPMLVHFPIAVLLTAVAADLLGRRREAVRRAAAGLFVWGAVSGWATAAAGMLAYLTVPAHTEAAHVWMYWHAGAAAASLVLFSGVAALRWRRRGGPAGGTAAAVEVLAAALLAFAGYLGGAVVYHGGAGVEPSVLAPEVGGGHSHGSRPVGGPAGARTGSAGPAGHTGHAP